MRDQAFFNRIPTENTSDHIGEPAGRSRYWELANHASVRDPSTKALLPEADRGRSRRESGTSAYVLPIVVQFPPVRQLAFRESAPTCSQYTTGIGNLRSPELNIWCVPKLVSFSERASSKCNMLPVGNPPKIHTKQIDDVLQIRVIANFGCQTKPGEATVSLGAGVLSIFARTILPDHPTPNCQCTRELEYRIQGAGGADSVRFHQDKRPPVEAAISP